MPAPPLCHVLAPHDLPAQLRPVALHTFPLLPAFPAVMQASPPPSPACARRASKMLHCLRSGGASTRRAKQSASSRPPPGTTVRGGCALQGIREAAEACRPGLPGLPGAAADGAQPEHSSHADPATRLLPCPATQHNGSTRATPTLPHVSCPALPRSQRRGRAVGRGAPHSGEDEEGPACPGRWAPGTSGARQMGRAPAAFPLHVLAPGPLQRLLRAPVGPPLQPAHDCCPLWMPRSRCKPSPNGGNLAGQHLHVPAAAAKHAWQGIWRVPDAPRVRAGPLGRVPLCRQPAAHQ